MNLKVYYNQKCSICNLEISHYQKKNIDCISWVDINTPSDDLRLLGKSHNEMMRRLHVIHKKRIYSGAKAFIVLWENMPQYKLLSKLLNLPVVYQAFYILYEIVAFFLYIKNRY